jgi:hypothetical protein
MRVIITMYAAQRYTAKADVYSFGIIMWECVTRADPYDQMPPFQV